MLFIGPRHGAIDSFVNCLSGSIVCSNNNLFCKECKNCSMFLNFSHPDVQYIGPDKEDGAIKIDVIRDLQFNIYQTPQCAKSKLVIINPADKLNKFAFNALLKILEEPPSHTIFILIAENINNMPATVISRCQKYYMHSVNALVSNNNNLDIASLYQDSDERGGLFKDRFDIIDKIYAIINSKTDICSVAAEFKNYNLYDFVWFLYLLTSQLIKCKYAELNGFKVEPQELVELTKSQDLHLLFKQIEKINDYFKTYQKNIVLNQTLVLENLLLGYL
jgi:DNA polymerase-3 subunit delta'